jgi:hypothetical protein
MENKQLIIAISGKKRSGKNTVGEFINDYFNHDDFFNSVRFYAFGDAVKETAAIMLGLDIDYFKDDKVKDEIFTFIGGKTFTGREILQIVGTQALRENFCDTVWITNINQKLFVSRFDINILTDLRFISEYEYLRSLIKFEVIFIRVNNNRLKDQDQHRSEIELDDYHFDFTINNYGTIEELKEKVFDVCRSIENRDTIDNINAEINTEVKQEKEIMSEGDYKRSLARINEINWEDQDFISLWGFGPEDKILEIN